MNRYFIYSILFLVLVTCKDGKTVNEIESRSEDNIASIDSEILSEETIDYKTLFKDSLDYKSDGFDYPVGKPNASGYYNAQKFQGNNHLGDDWNGVGGGNSDLGDSIYAIANGYISEVKDYGGGWGKVLRIVHFYNDKLYESLYAHCDTILVTQAKFVKKGEQIATIGNCNGIYLAHLHLELRDTVGLPVGPGYSEETTGYLNPTLFINKNRH